MKTALIVGIAAVALLAAMVAAWCKIAGRESRKEETEHPCAYCQRWGECNGVDEGCPLLKAYEETNKAIRNRLYRFSTLSKLHIVSK